MKRGRPKLPWMDRKALTLHVRLTQEEWNAVIDSVGGDERCISDFVREAIRKEAGDRNRKWGKRT